MANARDRFDAVVDWIDPCKRRRVDAGHHGSESTQLATHVEALKAVGFAEVGTLWQRGDNRLLCAVLPADQDGEGILSRRPTA